jgi:hypothetical protein
MLAIDFVPGYLFRALRCVVAIIHLQSAENNVRIALLPGCASLAFPLHTIVLIRSDPQVCWLAPDNVVRTTLSHQI